MMRRIFVATCLCLAGVALAAPPFVSAQEGKLTSDGLVTLDMTELGEGIAFTAFGSETECPGSTLVGHKALTINETQEGKQHGLIPAGSTVFTVRPAYLNCRIVDSMGAAHKVTGTMGGCDYEFQLGETVADDKYGVATGIVCPTGQSIQLEVYAFIGSELGGVICTVAIPSQSGLTGPVLTTDTASDDLRIEGAFLNVVSSRSGSGCATEEDKESKFDVNLTVQGTNGAGGATGITVTDQL